VEPDFDEVINRVGTNSLKFDFARQRGKPEDLTPMWVADMDFKAPEEVTKALEHKARHGVFGYSEPDERYYQSVKDWFRKRFEWGVESDWIVVAPGLVYAIYAAVRAFTEAGDAVMIQQPVYYPFASAARDNDRRLIINELSYDGAAYSIDFDDFERKIVENDVKLFILCSPHNPVGRVWTRDELIRLGDICVKRGVIVFSDEIHADFTYDGHEHLVFADLKPEFAEICVTGTSPSKTFNLAGLQISNIFIRNKALRLKFKQDIRRSGYGQANVMGLVACVAAYEFGESWLFALRRYLTSNLNFVRAYLGEKAPVIRLVEPEGTYLIWLDCKKMGLNDKRLDEFFVKKARLWLDEGTMFGAGGGGFTRVNIACPKSILERAMFQISESLKNL
jgi:cystathionine beta-lyase